MQLQRRHKLVYLHILKLIFQYRLWICIFFCNSFAFLGTIKLTYFSNLPWFWQSRFIHCNISAVSHRTLLCSNQTAFSGGQIRDYLSASFSFALSWNSSTFESFNVLNIFTLTYFAFDLFQFLIEFLISLQFCIGDNFLEIKLI